MANNVTDGDFEQEVLKSDVPVLIDFWAEWCGPCRMLTPVIEQLSKELDGKVKVLKMNIDENPHTPSAFGILSIPTMLVFKDGKQIASKVGVHSKGTIEEWINSII